MNPCSVCEHADRTGSWVDAPGHEGLTHCRRCHGSWSRASELQHCTVCCRTFTNVRAADLHRQNGVCVDPAAVVNKFGRRLLRRSTRRRDPRLTVTVWALGDPDAPSPWEEAS